MRVPESAPASREWAIGHSPTFYGNFGAQARDCTNRRYRYQDLIGAVERAKNKTKSRVRAKVEHLFAVLKFRFDSTKVRYRGLGENAHRLVVTCALANLVLARRYLLRLMA